MDLVASLPAFVAAVVLVSATPGPAVALIVRRASLVAASDAGFLALRVVGAVVLLALGFRSLRAAWRLRHGQAAPVVPPVGTARRPCWPRRRPLRCCR